jgi:3-deoxy-manno-octulosonate cytidylyltransferase (CMP-KDO synthetase)
MSFVVIIPSRFGSSRLPGKPLVDIAGKPMVQRVYEQAIKSGADRVIVATDDARIVTVAKGFGAEVCLTRTDHQSGTERLAEVIEQYGFSDDTIVVNVQGDEPLIPPTIIRQVADNLAQFDAPMATLAVEIDHESEVFNPNAVKVVTDKNGYALYFSRASVPWDRDHFSQNPPQIHHNLLRHIGLYAYRAGFVKQYIALEASPLEHLEALEQLRVLWHGEKIHVDIAVDAPPAGVDTPEDLELVRRLLA